MFAHNLIYSFIFIAIGTWYEAFTTPNDPPDYIPPAYIALEIPKDAINAGKFKRDVDGYIINRFVRQVSGMCSVLCVICYHLL